MAADCESCRALAVSYREHFNALLENDKALFERLLHEHTSVQHGLEAEAVKTAHKTLGMQLEHVNGLQRKMDAQQNSFATKDNLELFKEALRAEIKAIDNKVTIQAKSGAKLDGSLAMLGVLALASVSVVTAIIMKLWK